MSARYAVYYAPPAGSDLAELGDRWLGRNPRTGRALKQPGVRSIPPETLTRITESPRRYGFHATLKAPFRLADGWTEDGLLDAVAAFAQRTYAWSGPGLIVTPVDGFLALTPRLAAPALDALAADCVRAFDPFRAPLDDAEIQRRNPGHLTPRQRANLETWGYPYVFSEFRFHMTLTDRLSHPLRSHAQVALVRMFDAVCGTPFTVDAVSVFHQARAEAPFREIARCPLAVLAA
jgi:putative phosphonate metabolism protein